VVAKFIKQALDGEQLEIYGDGTQTRDFIFIDDLTRAIELAATGDNIGGETFQIASNRETTVHEMTELLVELLSQKIGIEVNVINGQVRVGDVKRNYSDTTKARTRLQWQPKITLNDGLAKTIDYFLKQRTMA
jgi:UDP-glucose 4-epimerase